jgi:CDP-glycerol glycerophosphotransferase (TagB/SpsB family)
MMDLPDHVTPLSYEGGDPQELFARARVFVTDFSSIAFNAAYLERPVVYYQFDEETVLEGGHVGRRGYFDYRRDGFGPVAEDKDTAVAATVDALAHGPAPTPEYQARIDASFTERDGRCCERVVEHVLLTAQRRSALPSVPTPVAP